MFLNSSIYDIKDYTDYYGNKTLKKRINIPFPVLNNKIETGEALDKNSHVYIDEMNEIGIQDKITDARFFKCNYDTGTIFVFSSLEGKTLNLTYSAKLMIRYKAKNSVIEDIANNYVGETVEDALAETCNRINNLIVSNPQPSEVQDARLDSARGITYSVLKNRLDKDSSDILDLQNNKVGNKNLDQLTTINKDSLINAINENKAKIDTNTNNITDATSKIRDLRIYLKDYVSYVVSNDWSPALQKANDDIVASGKLTTIVLSSDILLKAKVNLNVSYVRIDGNGYDIDCTNIKNGTCLEIGGTVNPSYRQNLNFIEDVRLFGDMTSTAILFNSNVTGAGAANITLRNINIFNFNVGLDYSNGAYLIKHYSVYISYCNTCLQVLSAGANYGENLSYFGCCFFNSDTAIYNSNNLCDMHFVGCSFDYNAKVFIINRAKIFCSMCHFESSTYTNIQMSINGNGGMVMIDDSTILYNTEPHTNYFAYVEPLASLSISNSFVSGLKNTFNTLVSGTGIVKIFNIKTFDGDTLNTKISDTLNKLIDGGFEQSTIVDNISITADTQTITNRLIGTNIKLEQVVGEHYSGSQSMRVQKQYGSGSNAKFSVFVPVQYGQKIDLSFMQKSNGITGTLKVRYNLANVIESKDGLHDIRCLDTKQNIDISVGTTSWSGYGLPNGEILVDKMYYNYFVIEFDFYYVNGLNNFWYLDDLFVSIY